MKIQLASDLHLELLQHRWPGERIIAPAPGAEVLVLAGDVADGFETLSLFADWPSSPSRVPIIYVAGNHEFYGYPIEPMRLKMKKAAALNNIHFLENESVVIGGARFLGTTLWTDYKLDPERSQQQQMDYVERRLNDHVRIRTGRHSFTTQDALKLHLKARAWLTEELAKPWAGKTVVVSHHAAHPLSVHPNYAGNPLNSGFVSDLSDFLPGVDLWLHGHTHSGFDWTASTSMAGPATIILAGLGG